MSEKSIVEATLKMVEVCAPLENASNLNYFEVLDILDKLRDSIEDVEELLHDEPDSKAKEQFNHHLDIGKKMFQHYRARLSEEM